MRRTISELYFEFIESYTFFIMDFSFSFTLSILLSFYYLSKTTKKFHLGVWGRIKKIREYNRMSVAEMNEYGGGVEAMAQLKAQVTAELIILIFKRLIEIFQFAFAISMIIAAIYSFYLVYNNHWVTFLEDPIWYLVRINKNYCDLFVKPVGILIVELILWPFVLTYVWLFQSVIWLGREAIIFIFEHGGDLFRLILQILEILREIIVDVYHFISDFISEQYYHYLHEYVKKIIIYIKEIFSK